MKSFCNKCSQETNREIVTTECDARVVEYFSKDLSGKIKDKFWSIHLIVSNVSKCKGCDTISLNIDEYHPNSIDESYIKELVAEIKDRGESINLKPINTQIYPPKTNIQIPDWIKELPENVMLLAVDVYRAYSYNMFSLAAMGIRTIIDAIATIKVGDIGGFERKLGKLNTDGFISEAELNILLSIIEVGHASSHRAYKPDEKTIKTCLELLNHVMEIETLIRTAQEIKSETPKRI